MGPCQGRLCHVNSIRVYAKATGLDENAIGTTTARPPHSPVTLGLLAGRPQEPVKRTSLHHRHEELGATMMWTGAWKRPHSYGPDAGAEARHVHRRRRPDRRLDARQDPRHGPGRGRVPRPRLPEPLLRPQGRPHPLRRAHGRRGPDHGRRHRRAARRRDVLRDDDVDRRRRASTSGSRGGTPSGRWTSASSQLTGAVAAINVAGPQARELMQRVSSDDFSNEGLGYLDATPRAASRACPCLALRIGFVGELGYELHFPSPHARARLGRAARARPRTSRRRRSASSRSGSCGSRRAT